MQRLLFFRLEKHLRSRWNKTVLNTSPNYLPTWLMEKNDATIFTGNHALQIWMFLCFRDALVYNFFKTHKKCLYYCHTLLAKQITYHCYFHRSFNMRQSVSALFFWLLMPLMHHGVLYRAINIQMISVFWVSAFQSKQASADRVIVWHLNNELFPLITFCIHLPVVIPHLYDPEWNCQSFKPWGAFFDTYIIAVAERSSLPRDADSFGTAR